MTVLLIVVGRWSRTPRLATATGKGNRVPVLAGVDPLLEHANWRASTF